MYMYGTPIILSTFVSGMLYGEISLIYLTIIGLGVAAFFLVSLGVGALIWHQLNYITKYSATSPR